MSDKTAPPSKAGLFFCLLKRHDWLFGLLLLAVTMAAYWPAWSGTPLWDDDGHITRAALRSWHGLARIWFEPGATQQYYPLVHSAFWLEHWIWGDAPPGYHLVSILLHCCSALLLLKILRRLEIPGAHIAAALFALHPVQVESVAWISELKNTLSGVFFFAAALAYLRFDGERKRAAYATALGLFLLGLASKTTVAPLPAVLLVVFWWKRGALSWRRDVAPLAPFFGVAIVAGIFTAWVERHFIIGRESAAFGFTGIERVLMAGRVLWFYSVKLLWPADLIFIYPRWHVSQGVCWQYLFPIGWLGLSGGLWLLRKRWRGPLAALLIFSGLLFPALGFFDVYPFVFSLVADHFQYLASAAAITLAAAGIAIGIDHLRGAGRQAGCAVVAVVIALLAVLTWNQSGNYTNAETLYRATLKANPGCWLAYDNLGNLLLARGKVEDAIALYRKALTLRPSYARAENNLGEAFSRMGRFVEAEKQFRRALEIDPHLAQAHNNLGNLLRGSHPDEAIAEYKKAIAIQPDLAVAHSNLGSIHYRQGRPDMAIDECSKALEFAPDLADAHINLGNALLQKGRGRDAIAHYEAAVKIQPGDVKALNNLAWIYATSGDASIRDGAKALAFAIQAERISGGGDPGVKATLAAAYARSGDFSQAGRIAESALRMAEIHGDTPLANLLRMQMRFYQANRPFQENAR